MVNELNFSSIELLYTRSMIDSLFETRRWLIFAYYRQWFTNYLMPLDWADLWLTLGCSFYMALQFFQVHFGHNDCKYYLKQVGEIVSSSYIEKKYIDI
jgi:aminopeptidase N